MRIIGGVAVTVACITTTAWAQADAVPADAGPIRYTFSPASELTVHTGKGGLLGMFGHEHDIRATRFQGTVWYDPADRSRSEVSVVVVTGGLQVVPASDSADIPKIMETMRAETLRVDSFPEIRFQSREVRFEEESVIVHGDLTIVGNTRPVAVSLRLQVGADTLQAEGSFKVKQTDFGIRPFSTAAGTVKVKDEVTFHLSIVAIRDDPAEESVGNASGSNALPRMRGTP